MTTVPWIAGAYSHILHPLGLGRNRGPALNEQWYINDHCFFVDASDRIHWFGITNPYPADGNLYGPGSHRHIGHAVSDHPFGPWEMRDHAMALPEGTTECIGACFVVGGQGEYLMVYGFNTGFHFARSDDLDRWDRIAAMPVLDLGEGTRDPCMLRMDDGEYLLFGAAGHGGRSAVVLAASHDLVNWTPEAPALLSDVAAPWGALESPFVHRRGDDYYLFVNFSHRQYQETLVFHSQNPRCFDWSSPLCTHFAHAAEILAWRGRTYISHCGIEDRHWSDVNAPYGLWLAELRWHE
ncbi:MAG: hypothetical protein NTU88_10820 [Armatimonadetes bacterium]|nr:hypothetical protein [Armatimonadota bacterium]